jgi:hypothetical protein
VAVAVVGFAGTANAGWYDPGWHYRTQLILNGSLVPAAQTNFPVLVAWTGNATLAAMAQASGNDILFTAGRRRSSITRSSPTPATGAIAAWAESVARPGTNTRSTCTRQRERGNQQNGRVSGTRASGRLAPRGEPGRRREPVTWTRPPAASNGTPQSFSDGAGGSTNAVGIVAGADNFLTDTYNVPPGNLVNRVEVPDNAILRPNGDFTVEAWVNLVDPATAGYLVYKWSGGRFAYQMVMKSNGSGGFIPMFQWLDSADSVAAFADGTTPLQANTWYHVVAPRAGPRCESTSTATSRARIRTLSATSTRPPPRRS